MARVNRLDSTIGEFEYDEIIADVTPVALETTAKLAESETPLARGTVLVATSADGQYKAVSEAIKATDSVLILAENLPSAEADLEAVAYKTGHFYGNRLKTDGEYELVAADWDAMRRYGYVFKDVIEEPSGSEAV